MSEIVVFDRLTVATTKVAFDRLTPTGSTSPTLTSVGTPTDGAALNLTGTNFSASGNTITVSQGGNLLTVPVSSEGTTSITSATLDTSGLKLTQPVSIYVTTAGGVQTNAITTTIASKTGESAFAITQQNLGDPSSRAASLPDLQLGDEVRFKNVQGTGTPSPTISDVTMTGQGVIKVTASSGAGTNVTSVDAAAQDGTKLSAYVTLPFQDPPSTVNVPNVVGMSQASATSAIQAAGLVVGTPINTSQSNTVANGLVAAQFPPAGTALVPGGAVEITLSLGAGGILVPNLIGISQDIADVDRSVVGLTGTDYRYIDGVNSGLVLNQSVVPGTLVSTGSSLDLVISSSLTPNVLGTSVETGVAVLEAANLIVDDLRYLYDPVSPLGTVVSQSPAPDTPVTPQAHLVITISLGPQPSVPGVNPMRRRLTGTSQ
jgi:beta-lactam-binding protein with PASTA domain